MPAAYSRSMTFSTGADTVCARVPCPFRGRLTRLTLTQTSGTAAAGTLRLYDRRGASSVATDLNVRVSGVVDEVVTHVDGCKVVFTDTHGLYVGESFEVKGCDVGQYNTTHTVLAVVNDTSIVSDIAYTADGSGGLWQLQPFLRTQAPVTHLVLQEEVYAGSPLYRLEMDRRYENRDNQNETTRLAYDALWLEFTPQAEASNATWELGFTIEPASFVS